LGDDFAFLFLGQSFIIALITVTVSGFQNGDRVFGTVLIIIPILSKSVFAYRKVTPFCLAYIELLSIVSAIDGF
tara:strand:+ start:260 stop:481 length:222 start_codon:yes stop_codon:yes gene_type:complete